MKNPVTIILDSLLYSNLFIACCAVAFAHTGVLLLNPAGPPEFSFLWFVFCSTYALYTAIRLQSMRNLADPLKHARLYWLYRFRHLGALLMLLSAIASVYFFFQLTVAARLWIVPAAVISIFYSLPFLPLKVEMRLRNKGVSKIFLISLVWAITGSVMAAAQMGHPTSGGRVAVLFASRFLFIFAITLPFDIRDLQIDRKLGLSTLPQILGASNSNVLAQLTLFISIALLIVLHSLFAQESYQLLLALLPLWGFTSFIIWQACRQRHEYWYLGLLDGSMIVQWLSFYLVIRVWG